MNATVTLDETGRLLLPSAVRRRQKLQPGAQRELPGERIAQQR